MAFVVGTRIYDTFILRDNSEVAITGKVGADFVVIEAYDLSSPSTTATVTLAEIGDGEYRISFVPTTPVTGDDLVWTSHVEYSSGGVFREFSEPYQVSADVPTTVIVPPSTGALAKSLQAIRREIGKDLGDFLLVTATAGNVSDSVWVDDDHLVGAEHAYRGRTLYVTAGTAGNLLEIRRVDDSSKTGTSLTLVRPLPSTIQISDEAELWGVHTEGWQPWEVNDTINNVIEDAGSHFFIPILASVTDAFDPDTRSITIPASITKGVVSLEYQSDIDDLWYPVHEQAETLGDTGYFVNRGQRTITIGGDVWPTLLDGLSLRILGYGVPARLTSDADTTDVNKEWIVRESMRRLLNMGWERKPEFVARRINAATREAEVARERALMRPAAGWKRL